MQHALARWPCHSRGTSGHRSFRSTKAAIKLHTLLDLRGNIPTFLHLSDGKLHDVNVLDLLVPEPGAFYVMDRGYIDFERLHRLHEAGSFFVTRAKSNLKAQRRYSYPVDRSTGLICDQTIVLTGFYSRQDFDTPLRRIKFKDPKTGVVWIRSRTPAFLTPPPNLGDRNETALRRARNGGDRGQIRLYPRGPSPVADAWQQAGTLIALDVTIHQSS